MASAFRKRETRSERPCSDRACGSVHAGYVKAMQGLHTNATLTLAQCKSRMSGCGITWASNRAPRPTGITIHRNPRMCKMYYIYCALCASLRV
jgi:hypothetical protein